MHALLRSPGDFHHLCPGRFMTPWAPSAQFFWYLPTYTLNLLSRLGSLALSPLGSISTLSVTLVLKVLCLLQPLLLMRTIGTKSQQQVLRSHNAGCVWERVLKATRCSPEGRRHHCAWSHSTFVKGWTEGSNAWSLKLPLTVMRGEE